MSWLGLGAFQTAGGGGGSGVSIDEKQAHTRTTLALISQFRAADTASERARLVENMSQFREYVLEATPWPDSNPPSYRSSRELLDMLAGTTRGAALAPPVPIPVLSPADTTSVATTATSMSPLDYMLSKLRGVTPPEPTGTEPAASSVLSKTAPTYVPKTYATPVQKPSVLSKSAIKAALAKPVRKPGVPTVAIPTAGLRPYVVAGIGIAAILAVAAYVRGRSR